MAKIELMSKIIFFVKDRINVKNRKNVKDRINVKDRNSEDFTEEYVHYIDIESPSLLSGYSEIGSFLVILIQQTRCKQCGVN